MSEFQLVLLRDWDQNPERQPVTKMEFVEYDEPDRDGFVGHISLFVQLTEGHFVEKRHRMRPSQFRFFVDEISERYHAGGPK